MSELSDRDRFEELEAGRILGDLDDAEVREWEELADRFGGEVDGALELVAAAIETEFLSERSESLPPALAERISATAPRARTGSDSARLPSSHDAPAADNIVRPKRWKEILATPQVAWGMAALFAILLVANFLATRSGDAPSPTAGRDEGLISKPTELVTQEARDALSGEALDVIAVTLAGLPGYDDVSGELIWSDARQEGYMTLTNLPVNDPTRNQYQLWIVDPSRDAEPVDGGVFNVFPDQEAALIPIDSKVAVSNPQAFLITLEKPGGVVVSDQEVKVALGKPS